MENTNATVELNRNWLELPCDVTMTILMKLPATEILEYAQFVCKLWYSLCKQPYMWRTVYIENVETTRSKTKHEKMLLDAVDRSAGGLIDLSVEGFLDVNDICSYVAFRANELKRFRLVLSRVNGEGLIEALEKLCSLEELELTLCSFEYGNPISIIKSRLGPALRIFKLNNRCLVESYLASDEQALAIAGCMPELHHLQLIGNGMTNVGLTAILDGCPHLQSLDLRACHHLDLIGDIDKRLSVQITDVKRPYDSIEDYKYPATCTWCGERDYDADWTIEYDYLYDSTSYEASDDDYYCDRIDDYVDYYYELP